MLRLQQLEMENFGPFKGTQSIQFPQEDGVTIVYGENMRGKTSLLNAIRYALFGKVLTRGSRQAALHKIGNWESADEGIYGFKVVLSFTYKGHDYVLTRTYRPKQGASDPESDQDYTEECFIRRDGTVLGPEERDSELARIMPEQVSRFFLFDGELLQEYEDLLRDDSEMGRKISAAIERILGVPVLTHARADLSELYKTAQTQESKAAQKDQKTRELGNHLADLSERRTHHEKEIERLRNDLEDLKSRKIDLERLLKKTGFIRALLTERDEAKKAIERIDEQLKEKDKQIRDIMTDAWRGVINEKVRQVQQQLQHEIDGLQNERIRKAVAVELLKKAKQGLNDGHCPTCAQELNEEATRYLKKLVEEYDSGEGDKEEDKLNRLTYLIETLRSFEAQDSTSLLREINSRIEELRVEKAVKEDRIKEINEETADYDEDEIRRQFAEHEETLEEIHIVEEGIKAEKQALTNVEEAIERIQKQLEKLAGQSLSKERRRRELYGQLVSLFADGVGVYRDNLRKKVEKDATDLFVMLTSEPDYAGLRINENYGLTIVHKDGREIPVRSAGAEHIVALSLIGALQKNAPLQGPIIMDSPFGRLDETHTTNVVRTLPSMAPQVMLLVYQSELDPQVARNELLGKLRSEYKMVRRSARHTLLQKCVEVEVHG